MKEKPIFTDPEYYEDSTNKIEVDVPEILKKDGLIIIHRNKKSPDIFPDNFKIINTRNYGISKIFFLI